jgi:signal transduction histidine kinase/CheY-like chemotaxis protein/HAMP domain-containing protein
VRARLITVFLVVKIIPLLLLTIIVGLQFSSLSAVITDRTIILNERMNQSIEKTGEIAVSDSTAALNDSAVENIERMTTDIARNVANFLYERDADIRYLSKVAQDPELYRQYINAKTGKVLDAETKNSDDQSAWVLGRNSKGEQIWVHSGTDVIQENVTSSNLENIDEDGFNYRPPNTFKYIDIPLYDEITFIDLNGTELIKVVSNNSPKTNYPLDPTLKDISTQVQYSAGTSAYINTYVKAENYWKYLPSLGADDIYVSDVIGAYVGSNYIGMYTPEVVKNAAAARPYDILYDPINQAFSGMENPLGIRFEGIVRWATPVEDNVGNRAGYITFALNHDHIMEFVDHTTPMGERYSELSNAYEGNYSFIWDYKCRSIAHPRHHSIVGYNPYTGLAETPWLESSIYEDWQKAGGVPVTAWSPDGYVQEQNGLHWYEFVTNAKVDMFDNQSRKKTPAPILTQMGLVGLDGRYLNNAPQCTGWMDLTEKGGSGSFYILWSGLYKLTTAAAIPYYSGQYSPDAEGRDGSKRGFGIVTIGAGLDDFTRPATETEKTLKSIIDDANEDLESNSSETQTIISKKLRNTTLQLVLSTALIVILVIIIAICIASIFANNLTKLIKGISRFRSGERQFRFDSPVKDEFGELADAFDDMADSVVDSIKNPLSIVDINRNIIYMNDIGLAYCQKSLIEVVGRTYGERDVSVYPINSQYCPIASLEAGREAEVYYHKDFDRYLQGHANYFYDKGGNKLGYIIESTDITEMIQEKMKIEEQRFLLDRILSASPDLIWYQDINGIYLAVNPRYASIVGKEPKDFIGHTTYEMFASDDFNIEYDGVSQSDVDNRTYALNAIIDSFISNDKQTIATGKPFYAEEKITFSDGHTEILDSVRTPLCDSTGKITGILGFARDITERVQIETKLRLAQSELEQAVHNANVANAHKGEFLARMSHEIRTPMNAIIGITDIIQRKITKISTEISEIADIKNDLKHIDVSSKHLLNLLNDILDISKIEAGKIDVIEESVELSKLINTVSEIIKPRCDNKNITFNVCSDDFGDSVFLTDALRLRQVLINLLGNAVKFTNELGKIDFSIHRVEESENSVLVKFSVRDTGIGIAEDKINTVFNSFEQGDTTISKKYGGTGLGLAISRRIVILLGGDISVTSTLGVGSEFSFTISLKITEAEQSITAMTMDDALGTFEGSRVLVVDDVDINRMILATLLTMTGVEIDEADDGLDAVAKFKAQAEFGYDLILMDIQMPNMDGYQASMAIRSLDRADAKKVPIVALTANAFKDDIDKAIKHGMNSHIAKPIEESKLVEALFKFIKKRK